MRVAKFLTSCAAILSVIACSRADRNPGDTSAAVRSPRAESAVAVNPPRDSAAAWRVNVSGAGPLRIGMTLSEAATALKASLPDTSKLDRACSYVRLDSVPSGILLMWVDGRLARLDVDSASIPTELGARVGDSEASVRKLYEGRFTEKPHKYVETGKYIVVAAPMAGDGSLRLVFETDSSKITRYRAGREPEVEWIEGCA